MCYKQGKSVRFANVNTKRCRGALKESCNAKLVVTKSEAGSFVVSIFTEEGNHPIINPKKNSYPTVASLGFNCGKMLDSTIIFGQYTPTSTI